MHRNSLEGVVPWELFTISSLKELYLNDNLLSGDFPNDVVNLSSLSKLRFENNQFSGNINNEICNIELAWDDPIYFNISNNKICSPYPICINEFVGYQDISNCDQVSIMEHSIGGNISIKKAFPNPFNSNINLVYSLPYKVEIEIFITDILGRKIVTLYSGIKEMGRQVVAWNGYDDKNNYVGSGIYFLTISAGKFQKTIKIGYVK